MYPWCIHIILPGLPLWQIEPGQLRRWFSGCRLSPEKWGVTLDSSSCQAVIGIIRDLPYPSISMSHYYPNAGKASWVGAGRRAHFALSPCLKVVIIRRCHCCFWQVLLNFNRTPELTQHKTPSGKIGYYVWKLGIFSETELLPVAKVARCLIHFDGTWYDICDIHAHHQAS